MDVHIRVFGVLKDFFPSIFTIRVEENISISKIKQEIISQNKNVEHILNTCKFAIHDEFVDNQYLISQTLEINILPPSSGG